MYFELKGKLEFSSYLALVLVPHLIGDGMLGSIYTNSSHAYCYGCWAMCHIPTRAHTSRTEPVQSVPCKNPSISVCIIRTSSLLDFKDLYLLHVLL